MQSNSNSNWLASSLAEEGGQRPGSCHTPQQAQDLSQRHLNFIKDNVLMDRAVGSAVNLPHFVRTSPHERLTTVAVDAGVAATDGKSVDVLFVGTTRGRVLKLATFSNGGIPQTNVIEELQIFPFHVAVNNIIVLPAAAANASGSGSLIAVSEHEVKKVPVARCGAQIVQSCWACVNLQVNILYTSFLFIFWMRDHLYNRPCPSLSHPTLA